MCRANRLNDLVGRCVAEQSTASKTFAVTLTYSGDGPESAVLRYKDVQQFLYRLRAKRGGNYKVRYIVAGEYGTKKGRSHWHCILFFYGDAPDVRIGSRINWRYWPHGFSYFQNPNYGGFKYVMKYALKQIDNDGASKSLSMSKKPPLGYKFFMTLADDMVERRIAMRSPEYSFAHVRDRNGIPRKYWLQGRMREKFLDRYYTMWRMRYDQEPPWTDFLLESYLDKIERARMDIDPLRLERDAVIKLEEYERKRRAQNSAEFAVDLKTKRNTLGYLVIAQGKTDLAEAFSDGSADIWIGNKKWLVQEGSVSVGEQLRRIGLSRGKAQAVLPWLEMQWRNHRHQVELLSA